MDETIRVTYPGLTKRAYREIPKEYFDPERHTLYQEPTAKKKPRVTSTYHKNARWVILVDGRERERGVGKPSFEEALKRIRGE